MHGYDEETEDLARAIVAYARGRIANPAPLDRSAPAEELARRAGETITPEGIGGEEALRVWAEVLGARHHLDGPPRVPRVRAGRADEGERAVRPRGRRVVDVRRRAGSRAPGASGRRTRRCAGSPTSRDSPTPPAASSCRGGIGGQPLGARRGPPRGRARRRVATRPVADRGRRRRAHSSVASAARVMDVDVLTVPPDERGRLTGEALREALDAADGPTGSSRWSRAPGRPTPGWSTTSPGSRTSARSAARGCTSTAPTAARDCSHRRSAPRFDGIERADSFIVDPHKWLFAPFDACALLYRDAGARRAAHVAARVATSTR